MTVTPGGQLFPKKSIEKLPTRRVLMDAFQVLEGGWGK